MVAVHWSPRFVHRSTNSSSIPGEYIYISRTGLIRTRGNGLVLHINGVFFGSSMNPHEIKFDEQMTLPKCVRVRCRMQALNLLHYYSTVSVAWFTNKMQFPHDFDCRQPLSVNDVFMGCRQSPHIYTDRTAQILNILALKICGVTMNNWLVTAWLFHFPRKIDLGFHTYTHTDTKNDLWKRGAQRKYCCAGIFDVVFSRLYDAPAVNIC